MKIAFQGEPGAYSEAAGKNIFGLKHQFIHYKYFEDVFKAVKNNEVHRGVIPIENSLAGSIHQNYDLLQKYRLKIIQETHLRIEHVLMCHETTDLKKITEVRSHPQALAQCSQFFKRKKISQQVWYDTAGAAKQLSEEQPTHIGAIASIYAAQLYKLKILKRNLENNHQNFTRFLAISTKDASLATYKGVKTSISIAPKKNQSGILFNLLEIFAAKKIDLLKIESRPMPNRYFEYIFYLDFEGHAKSTPIKEALAELKKASASMQVFGSFLQGGRSYFK